jgi:hypothetical protein
VAAAVVIEVAPLSPADIRVVCLLVCLIIPGPCISTHLHIRSRYRGRGYTKCVLNDGVVVAMAVVLAQVLREVLGDENANTVQQYDLIWVAQVRHMLPLLHILLLLLHMLLLIHILLLLIHMLLLLPHRVCVRLLSE